MADPESSTEWAPHPLRPYRPLIISVALTGAVPSKSDNPNVPITPDEIIEDALDCAEAGAACVHLHVRDESGAPTHSRDLYEYVIAGIRKQRPEVILCATTSSRVGNDLDARMMALDLDDDLLPDLVSVTLGSANFPRSVNANPPDQIVALLERAAEVGVRPELEVFELGMVNTLHVLRDRGLVPDPPIVNVLLGSLGSAPAFVGDLATIAQRLPAGSEWAAAGVGVFQRPMVIAAAVLGGNVRTGLEDNPHGHGDPHWRNADAVAFAADAATLAGRDVADTVEARRRLGLPPVDPGGNDQPAR